MHLIFAEDQPELLRFYEKVAAIAFKDFSCHYFPSAQASQAFIDELGHADKFVLVTDRNMEEANIGISLLKKAGDKKQFVGGLMVTGLELGEDSNILEELSTKGIECMQKPVNTAALIQRVKEISQAERVHSF